MMDETMAKSLARMATPPGTPSPSRYSTPEADVEMGTVDETTNYQAANYAYNVSMTTSTNAALVKKATASLEPLCGRLCEHAGQPGFSLGVEWDEIEKLRMDLDDQKKNYPAMFVPT